jgi:hypothetical protein
MSALGMIAYMVAAIIVGMVLTLIMSIFRNIKNNDEFKSWRWMSFFAVLTAVAPYGYSEIKTKMDGADMQKAVEATLKSAKVNGKLSYYRVQKSSPTAATVIIVSKEKTSINNAESCVLIGTLKKDPKKGWKPDRYEFVDSFERAKDGVTFPPYW